MKAPTPRRPSTPTTDPTIVPVEALDDGVDACEAGVLVLLVLLLLLPDDEGFVVEPADDDEPEPVGDPVADEPLVGLPVALEPPLEADEPLLLPPLPALLLAVDVYCRLLG